MVFQSKAFQKFHHLLKGLLQHMYSGDNLHLYLLILLTKHDLLEELEPEPKGVVKERQMHP